MQDDTPRPDFTQLKGADGIFETVTVQGKRGPVRINKHEYDEKRHGRQLDERSAKAGGATRQAPSEELAPEDMTVDELKSELDRRQIEYKSDDLKDDLVKKLRKGK